MGMSEPKYQGGRLVGYTCALGHTHPSASLANECDPSTWSKEQKEKARVLEAQRLNAIKVDPRLEGAIAAAKTLGASDSDASSVVYKNGIDAVLNALKAVTALGIPDVKKAEPAQK